MEHVWLDSLSEDWVSQPRSSGSPAPSLPSTSNTGSYEGRIPKHHSQQKSWAAQDINSSALAERSASENNVHASQRGLRRPSKLREEVSDSDPKRQLSRSLSASDAQSVQRHTVESYGSVNISPQRAPHETPEWKRRLLHGDVAYGEQRDLFGPSGLEGIFRPPPTQPAPPTKFTTDEFEGVNMTMPSSPPPYNKDRSRESEESQERVGERTDRRQPRAMKYNMVDVDGSEFSANDLSRSSSFRPAAATSQKDDSQAFSDSVSAFSVALPRQQDSINGATRVVSGQSDIRNEGLSPIYISQRSAAGDNVEYDELDLSVNGLQSRLERIQTENEQESIGDSSQVAEGNTVATEDYARNGLFVNVQRGGRSHEGSFRRRMLSPSSPQPIEESVLLPEESMQASTPKQLPNIQKTRPSDDFTPSRPVSHPLPPAPHPSPAKPNEVDGKSSAGSPLKIFGGYDTFTNQKLLRRLSQFEEHFDSRDGERPSTDGSTRTGLNEAFVETSSPKKVSRHTDRQPSRNLNSFGKGELDDFEFHEEISHDSSRVNPEEEDKKSAALPVLDPTTQTKFKFQLEPSPVPEDAVLSQRKTRHVNTSSTKMRTVTIRRTSRPITSSSASSAAVPPSQGHQELETPRKRVGESEGKRLYHSPSKDPTPKRRRTLQNSDIVDDIDDEVEQDVLRNNQRRNSIIGKRKDARHENDLQKAHPKVLAMRQILRPRTPTPSQRSSLRFEPTQDQEASLDSVQYNAKLQENKIARIQAELDSNDLPKPLAALGMSVQAQDGSRKGSVTTQDFLDEAKKIMAGIRGKARPRSGLNSLEESESDTERKVSRETIPEDDEFEDSYESTQEPFSRPPSRDGRPVQRPPAKQHDPELLDHLRKYEEMSDMDEVIASSIRSIAMARDATRSAQEINRLTEEAISKGPRALLGQDVVESDPPNIRITENPEILRKRKHSSSSVNEAEGQHDVEFPSQGSSTQSTARSIPTGSSRGSDSRRVIAPHTVSHLIPEQLAGMVFDRERNIWVKGKQANGKQGQVPLRADETDDDPFGDIPDLSVDETQERQRLKAAAAKLQEEGRTTHIQNGQQEGASSRPATSGLHYIPNTSGATGVASDASSEPSKFTRLGSSTTHAETNTRVTSWADGPLSMGQGSKPHGGKLSKIEIREEVTEEVEREISLYEDRVQASSPRRRNVTISFSSPLASIIQTSAYDDNLHVDSESDDANQADSEDYEDHRSDSVFVAKRNGANVSSMQAGGSLRATSRQLSLGGRGFLTRPVSRIDEQDEESFNGDIDEERHRSVSIVVSTPLPMRAAGRAPHDIGTLELTPLSDFTVHHGNESFGLEVSYIERGQRYALGGDNKRALSLSIKDIVSRITEVEPYEPFWEHMKEMQLKDKKLTNLHKLEEFCGRLEELDVSNNQISQLNGAPQSIRHLRITHNYLSDLTAWGHLSNLQYIDVSNNEIESLSAFKNLVHLRGLRADNNKIKSLDGIRSMNGLLNLRLRGNLIESIDFKDTQLQRLSDLDLNGNRIHDVQNLHLLSSLSSLNLENNNISTFEADGSQKQGVLKYLKLGGNNLEFVDVGQYPNLRLLYLDRNRLGKVTGLSRTKHLDSLSMREQQQDSIIDPSFLAEAFEVRKLFLSGNFLGSFEPPVDFMNLQYLELANCGLESLPVEFGQMFPNVRVLNLNFNALKDIRPLFGVARLKKIHLAGNRVQKLRTATNVLAQFPTLAEVDLRSNPLTQGFYPPVIETRLIHRETGDADDAVCEPFSLAPADEEKDKKYVSRLDMETKMLRRVYEMLVVGRGGRIRVLDGLRVDVTAALAKDAISDALVRAGIVQVDIPEAVEDGNLEDGVKVVESSESCASKEIIAEEVWQVEDSFA